MGRRGRAAAALALGGVMLWQPEVIMAGAARGCALWASAVMPGLLPFMICVLYAAGHLEPSPRGAWPLLGLSRGGGLLGGMGWLTGSPGGARLLAEGFRRRVLGPGEVTRLAIYTGVMSPMFVLGTLPAWAGMPGEGWRLLAAHWLGALGAGQLMRLIPEKEVFALPTEGQESSRMTLPQAIREACQAMIAIAGCMALGCAVSDLVKALCPGLPAGVAAILQCGLEVTAGCRALLEAGFPAWCLAGAVSLGGLSLWLQNLAFYPAGLPLKRIALGRLLACGLSLGFGWLLRPRTAAVFAPAAAITAAPSPGILTIFTLVTWWSTYKGASGEGGALLFSGGNHAIINKIHHQTKRSVNDDEEIFHPLGADCDPAGRFGPDGILSRAGGDQAPAAGSDRARLSCPEGRLERRTGL